MSEEIWRPVPGYEGFYEVSSLGRMRSLDRIITSVKGSQQHYWGKILAQRPHHGGYWVCSISKDRVGEMMQLHKLVARVFVPPFEGVDVTHKDLDKSNNKADNLAWVLRPDWRNRAPTRLFRE